MDYKSAVKIINELESEQEVDKIEYKGYAVWPILKYYLLQKLLAFSEADSSVQSEKNIKKQQIVSLSLVGKVKFYFKSVFKLISHFFKYQTQFLFFKIKKSSVDYLVLDVRESLYEDIIKGRKYSKYISPYVEFLRKTSSLMLINTFESKPSEDTKIVTPIYFNSKHYLAFQKLLIFFKKRLIKTQDERINQYDVFQNYVSGKPYSTLISEQYLIYLLEDILLYEKFWLKILEVVRPKAIFFECYYGNLSYSGLFSAAKKKNIPTVDIQHGISLGLNYLNWYKTPEKGYEFLPTYYWCWGEVDVQNVLKTRGMSKDLFPLLGGNLWLSKNNSEEIENKSNVLLERLLQTRKNQKIILVSLQHSIPVSKTLIEAIQKSGEEIFWLIRFHPRDYVAPGYRQSYIDSFKGLGNVEYSLSTKANLYSLFTLTDIHITHHSNVAVEAISFNVPTILLGDQYVDIYKDYIVAGHFYVALDSKQILEFIENGISINKNKVDYFKMQFDHSFALNLLKQIENKQ